MNTIHFFGDSWTKGDGCQFEPGSGVIESYKKYGPDYTIEYDTFSFPVQMGKMLDNKFNIKNNAFSGGSNFQIYKSVLHSLNKNEFKQNDIAIVVWSSIIREPLSFLFTIEHLQKAWDFHNLNYSIKGHTNPKNKFIPSWINQMIDSESKKISKKIYEDFIVDRINLNFLYEICMNYICNLQILFEEIGIDYVFINSFENIVSNDIHFYNKINKDNWILFGSTLSDYLCDIEDEMDLNVKYTIWEDDHIKPGRNLDGPHPNRIGYGYIAELVYKELINKNIL